MSPISCRPTRRTGRRMACRRRWNSRSRRSRCKHIVVLGHAQCGGVRAYRRGCRAALARRLHRQMDGADGARAGQGSGRAATLAGRLPDAARTGQRRQQPRQPDDVSAAAQADRARQRSRSTAPISASRPARCRCCDRDAARSDRSRRRSTRECSRSRDFDSAESCHSTSPRNGGTGCATPCYAAFCFAWISLRLIRLRRSGSR